MARLQDIDIDRGDQRCPYGIRKHNTLYSRTLSLHKHPQARLIGRNSKGVVEREASWDGVREQMFDSGKRQSTNVQFQQRTGFQL